MPGLSGPDAIVGDDLGAAVCDALGVAGDFLGAAVGDASVVAGDFLGPSGSHSLP